MTELTKRWTMRLVLIAGSASLLAACQSSPYAGATQDGPVINRPRPEFPTRPQGGLDNPPVPPPPASAPAAPPQDFRPSPPVTSQPIAPPTELAPPAAAPVPAYVPPPPPPPPPPQPTYRAVTIGPVVEAEGPPKVYTVKSGDNLDAIAREMGVTRKELADRNDLKEPYRIKPGQKLKGPASKNAKAYVVQQGDTLSAIGRRFAVSASALADENDMALSDSLRPGKRLLLPKGYKDNGPGRVLVYPESVPVQPPVQPPVQAPVYTPPPAQPQPPVYTPPPVQPPVYVPPPVQPPPVQPQPQPSGAGCVSTNQLPQPLPAGFPTAAQLRQMAQGKFAWPVRGRVLTCFGPQPGVGVASNGIDIAANPNTSVKASAAGELIHANPVKGTGLTVLVQHADGWITIYSNLSSISVPARDAGITTDADNRPLPRVRIAAGQEIGRSGGAADGQAMVHFEVRYGRENPRPIDPELVLPPR